MYQHQTIIIIIPCKQCLLDKLCYIWLRPYKYDDGYIDGRSQIKVHTDERTHRIHSAQSSPMVTLCLFVA